MIKTDIILNGRFLELINDVSMPFTYQIIRLNMMLHASVSLKICF